MTTMLRRSAKMFETLGASANLVRHVCLNMNRLVHDAAEDVRTVSTEMDALQRETRVAAADVRTAITSAPRFMRIITEVGRALASYRIAHASAALLGKEEEADHSALHKKNAARITDLCIELGGGLLKIGQLASSRVDLLPKSFVDELSRLQDQASCISADEVRAHIELELGASIESLFSRFDDVPLAAASLAQVHRGRLLDGREVAIKVLRPGIEAVIEVDLAALRAVSHMLADVIVGVDLETTATELTRSVREELDFRQEATNAARLGAHFADSPDVIIPKVVEELSTRSVLVMEYIDGTRLRDFLDSADSVERDRILEIMLETFAAQIVDLGVFHADPHPGNFLVVRETTGTESSTLKLAMLDFGSVFEMPQSQTQNYAKLCVAFLARDLEKVGLLMADLGFVAQDPQWLVENASVFLRVFDETMPNLEDADLDPREAMNKAIHLARRYPIDRVPPDFVQMTRVFGALGGLFLHYKPRIKLHETLLPFVMRAWS